MRAAKSEIIVCVPVRTPIRAVLDLTWRVCVCVCVCRCRCRCVCVCVGVVCVCLILPDRCSVALINRRDSRVFAGSLRCTRGAGGTVECGRTFFSIDFLISSHGRRRILKNIFIYVYIYYSLFFHRNSVCRPFRRLPG